MLIIAILVFILSQIILLPWDRFFPKRNVKTLFNSMLDKKDMKIEERFSSLIENIIRMGGSYFKFIKPFVSSEKIEEIRGKLVTAGMSKHTAEQILGSKIMFSLYLTIVFGIKYMLNPDALGLLSLAVVLGIGFYLPEQIVTLRMKKRQTRIILELPNALNTMAIMTEAGLGFFDAIDKLCEVKTGPLIEEFKKVNYEIGIGLRRKDALERFGTRCRLEEVEKFVATLVQTIEKGAGGVSKMLRGQAEEMWDKRKSLAKELGNKASIKLFMPMALLSFPAMIILIIGPTGIELMRVFFGGK